MSLLALDRKVLCLNKKWTAIGCTPIIRAIKMLFKTHSDGEPYARIIDPANEFQTYSWEDWSRLRPKEGEVALHSAESCFRIPEVILLTRFDKFPQQKRSNFSRRSLFKRDDNTCMYCGKQFPTMELSIDHIIPRSQGGVTSWTNCVLACFKCNRKKSNLSLEQANMKLIRQPFKPKYDIFPTDIRLDSWQAFLDEAYWGVPLKD